MSSGHLVSRTHPQTLSSVAALLCLTLGAPAVTAADEGALARGGRIYDKWYKVVDADAPTEPHPLYPSDKEYASKPGSNWRCKECHGWDYIGKDGAYSAGKHHTGVPGIRGAAGSDLAKIAATLKGEPHGYGGRMDDADIEAVALFVSKGQFDMDALIDRSTKLAKGDPVKGKEYYDTLCAQCHGVDGRKIEDMKPMGALAKGNPWENLHKILNGQPAEEMPALRALDIQVSVDILRYTQDLPEK